MAPRTLALALPAAGLVAAPLFVPGAPSTQGTQAPRTAARAAHAAAQTPSSLSAATVGAVASAGVLVAALSRSSGRTSRPHVARNFFGEPTSAPASFDPATELGVQDPVGFWDPLGLAADKDKATFNRRRAVELKHGRIAMYATIGYIVPEYFRWPGFLSPSLGLKFSDMPNGLAALSKLPVLGGAQIIAFAGLIETTGFFQAASTTDGRGPREGQFSMKDSTESSDPGNYGVGFPNFLGKVEDPEARKTKLAAELANGRLAMMAIIGMFFQDGLTGSAWGDWSTYTASPLRAYDPSEEVGAMPPLGFFDPLNFSKPGRPLGVFLQDLSDEEKFAWLRAAELKNGRVAMMATVGAIFQHFVRLPGFESMPAGIKAIEKAPGSYGFVILWILAGVLELGPWRQVADKEPGNFGDPMNFNQYTKEMREREINNGRFAMFAAIGIIAAEMYTGKDAVEQWG